MFLEENFRLETKRMDLRTLADKVCNVHDVLPGELCSGRRRHEMVGARRMLSWPVVMESGYCSAEFAASWE